MPAILAIAYHSFVGSSGPVSSAPLDRLSGQFRIDAGGTEEQETVDAGTDARMNDVRFDHQIVVDENRPGTYRWRRCRRPLRRPAQSRRDDGAASQPRRRPDYADPRSPRLALRTSSPRLVRQRAIADPTMPLCPATPIFRALMRNSIQQKNIAINSRVAGAGRWKFVSRRAAPHPQNAAAAIS